jgi:hypothetical protein
MGVFPNFWLMSCFVLCFMFGECSKFWCFCSLIIKFSKEENWWLWVLEKIKNCGDIVGNKGLWWYFKNDKWFLFFQGEWYKLFLFLIFFARCCDGNNLHASYCGRCDNSNLHVYCYKPMCIWVVVLKEKIIRFEV